MQLFSIKEIKQLIPLTEKPIKYFMNIEDDRILLNNLEG